MIIGVDPGLYGALALLPCGNLAGLRVADMPTVRARIGRKERDRIDEHAIWRTFRYIAETSPGSILVIEDVHGLPQQSAAAGFTFGYGVGVITMAAIAANLRIERVASSTWKSALKVPSDKRAARGRASDLFPGHSDKWPLQKHDGRAEAAMIAYWGQKVFGITGNR